MPKRFTLTLIALLLVTPAATREQTDEHKYEVGAVFNGEDMSSTNITHNFQASVGFGHRF